MNEMKLEVSLGEFADALIFKKNLESHLRTRKREGNEIPSRKSMMNLLKEVSHRDDIKIIDSNETEAFIKKAYAFISYTIGTNDSYSDEIEKMYEKRQSEYDSIIDTFEYNLILEFGFHTLFPVKRIDNCVKLYKILMYNDLVVSGHLAGNGHAKPFEDVQRIVKNKNKKFYNFAIQSINKGTPSDYVKYFLGKKSEDLDNDEIAHLMSTQSGLREKSALNLIFTFANNLDAVRYLGIVSITDDNFSENYDYQIKTQSISDTVFKRAVEDLKKDFKTISNASKKCLGVDIGHAKSIEEICMVFHAKSEEHVKNSTSNKTILQSQMSFTQVYGISSQHEKISEEDLWVFLTYVKSMSESLFDKIELNVFSEERDIHSAYIITSGFIKMYQESDNTLNSKGTHLYREQITQLQASNEELQVNYIRMKDDKNDDINRLDKIIKEHTKEVNRISLQHEKEVKKLNKKIDEYKKMEQELEALREFMQASNQEEQVVRFDMDKALEEINKRPVIMIGGFTKWVDKVREVIPNLKHLSADELGRSYNAIRDENAIVLFHAGYNNHGSYYKFINNINNGAKLIYLNTGSNIELLIKRIYDKLQ